MEQRKVLTTCPTKDTAQDFKKSRKFVMEETWRYLKAEYEAKGKPVTHKVFKDTVKRAWEELKSCPSYSEE